MAVVKAFALAMQLVERPLKVFSKRVNKNRFNATKIMMTNSIYLSKKFM